MSLDTIGSTGGNSVAFIVGAGIVYEIVAANCSSPQTTELNAGARADTLMKWVNIGMVQSAVIVGAAALIEPKRGPYIVAGGAVAGVFMYACYWHAKKAGLNSDAPGTEQWGDTFLGLGAKGK